MYSSKKTIRTRPLAFDTEVGAACIALKKEVLPHGDSGEEEWVWYIQVYPEDEDPVEYVIAVDAGGFMITREVAMEMVRGHVSRGEFLPQDVLH